MRFLPSKNKRLRRNHSHSKRKKILKWARAQGSLRCASCNGFSSFDGRKVEHVGEQFNSPSVSKIWRKRWFERDRGDAMWMVLTEEQIFLTEASFSLTEGPMWMLLPSNFYQRQIPSSMYINHCITFLFMEVKFRKSFKAIRASQEAASNIQHQRFPAEIRLNLPRNLYMLLP